MFHSLNRDVYPFIKDKKEEDVRNLTEFIQDLFDQIITLSDIKDLIKIINLFSELKDKKCQSDKVLIDELRQLCSSEKYKNIEACIENIVNNFSPIKELYNQTMNKSEFSKEKLKQFNSHNNSIYEYLSVLLKLNSIISLKSFNVAI